MARSKLADYAALTKPKIVPLLLMVALGSTVVASNLVLMTLIPSPMVLAGILVAGGLTSLGVLTLNSYLESDIDAQMRRTKSRPLPAQRIVPASHALVMGLALVGLGIATAFLTLNLTATLFIGLGAVVYVPVYTL